MNFVKILFLCLSCMSVLANSQSDDDGSKKEGIFSAAELYFARMFENESQKLRKTAPLTLNEEILSVKISNDSFTDLRSYEAFDSFHWESEIFITTASKNKTCVFLTSVSDYEAHISEFFAVEHLNFVQNVDFLKVLVIDDKLWIFEAEFDGNIIFIIRITLNDSLSVRVIQQAIPFSNPIKSIYPFASKREINLIVVTQKVNENASLIFFTEENGLLLKTYDEQLVYGRIIHSVDSFTYDEVLFLVLLGEKEAIITRFDAGNKHLHEIWSEANVHNFLHFKDEISDNLFLAFISENDVKIYLFRDDKLLDWSKFSTDSNMKIANFFSHRFSNFLILADEANVTLFSQNEYGEFFPDLSFTTFCNDLKDVRALPNDREIVFVSHCVDREEIFLHQLQIMDNDEFQNDSPEDLRIEKCLREVEDIIRQNDLLIPKLLDDHKRRPVFTEPSPHFANEPKIWPGAAASRNFVSLISTVESLSKTVDDIKNKTKTFEDRLPNLLTYEGSQHIYTTVNAKKMVANNSVILSIDLEKLNEMPLDDYRTKFMVLDRDQFVNIDISFNKIITKNINTKSFITDNLVLLPENLLETKNPNQVVSGLHKFSSLEVTDGIESGSSDSYKINGINLNDVVMRFSDVKFAGQHTFHKTLNSQDHLNLKYINGVDYDAWSGTVMKSSKDPSLPFGGSILVDGNVHVAGNIKALSVNGIDFASMFRNIAKRSSATQEFKDKIIFSNVLKTESLEVKHVNDLLWSDYLRVRDEVVNANFNINDGVIIGDLKSTSINGINVGEDVMLSGPDQMIKGRITFVNDVEVTANSGVTMETGATINAVDPSLHAQVGDLSNNEVFHRRLNLGDVLTINGDIRVVILNHVPFPDFKVGYWRKSEQQRIPNSISIKKAEFKKSFYASTFNGYDISDYVRTDIPQTFVAKNFFVSNAYVSGNVYIENNRTIGKVDLSSVKDSAVTLQGNQIIVSSEFTNVVTVKSFKSEDGIFNRMHFDKFFATPLRYSNVLVFTSPVEAYSLHTRNLQVGKLNENTVHEVLHGRSPPITEIKGNLYVDRITVQDLIFTKHLNGQNFNKWMSLVVLKDKADHYFSKKVFIMGDVFFSGSLDINILNLKHLQTFIKKLTRDCVECEVRGKKLFLKPVEITGDIFAEYINDVSLRELKTRLLSKTKEQTIKGIYKFQKGLTSVTVETPKISGIPIDDIVMANDVNLQLPTKFRSDLILDELHSSGGWIGGCKLEEIFNPPLMNVRNLLANISVGHLEVTGNMTLEGKIWMRSNNEDLLAVLKKLVTKSGDQKITGLPGFNNLASIQSLNSKFVNKHRTQDLIENFYSRKNELQTNCDLDVKHLLISEVICADVSTDFVNGMRLKTISDLGVKRNSSQEVITGTKTFPNAIITANLDAHKINNISLSTLIEINGDNAKQHLILLKPASFTKNILVYGLIAQENPKWLFKHFDFKLLSSSLPFPTNYEQLIIEGDLNVNVVNGLNLDDLLLKTSKFPVITGRKNFIGGLIIEGGSRIEVINGFHANQFQQWPYIVRKRMPERYSQRDTRGKSLDRVVKVELTNEAFALVKVNEANLELAKGLHKRLFSITKAARINLKGDRVHTLRLSRATVAHVFAEYDACLSRNLCPCFDTYTLNVNNKMFELDDISFKGKNFQILLPENQKIYNFNFRCSDVETSTFISKLYNTEGGVLFTKEKKDYNILHNVFDFHVSGLNYFLLHTKSREGNSVTLTVVNENLERLWEANFNASISKLLLKKIFENWCLFVFMDEVNNDLESISRGTKFYTFIPYKNRFELVRNFPVATTGDITLFGNEIFLVLGLGTPSIGKEGKVSYLQIYRAIGSYHFYPFTSLPVVGVSSAIFFAYDHELFLALALKLDNSISVYRMTRQEGFSFIESFSVVHPTELSYFSNQNQPCLLVLHDKMVTLLDLNFKGASLRS